MFLCMVWGCVLVSLIHMQLSSFPNITCYRVFFPFYILKLLCQRLIGSRCQGLFLFSLFCSICPYVCFCTSTTLSSWLYLCNIIWSLGELYLLLVCLFVFLPSGLLWQFWVFMFPLILWNVCSTSVKNVMDNVIGIALNP